MLERSELDSEPALGLEDWFADEADAPLNALNADESELA